MAKARGMGCAIKGGGKGKMIKATSKTTGPIMMRKGGCVSKKAMGGYMAKKAKGGMMVSPRKRMAMGGKCD